MWNVLKVHHVILQSSLFLKMKHAWMNLDVPPCTKISLQFSKNFSTIWVLTCGVGLTLVSTFIRNTGAHLLSPLFCSKNKPNLLKFCVLTIDVPSPNSTWKHDIIVSGLLSAPSLVATAFLTPASATNYSYPYFLIIFFESVYPVNIHLRTFIIKVFVQGSKCNFQCFLCFGGPSEPLLHKTRFEARFKTTQFYL